MPKVALFLGAGASKAFGYPTTKEFLTRLVPKVENEHPFVRSLLSVLREPKSVEDIEHILQMLDAFIDLNSNMFARELLTKYPPPFLGKMEMTEWHYFPYFCDRLKKRIIQEPYSQYQFTEDKVSRIVPHYGRLFEDVARFNPNGRLDIFTTNYDSVVEEFCDSYGVLDIELIDGFIPRARSGRLFWGPAKAFERNFRKDADLKLRLFKLHGSLNWGERNKGYIEKVIETQVADLERYRRNVLIYPAQKTYEEEEPFSVLHKYFRDAGKTSMIFVVIGFSFRDDLINRVFLDHLRQNPRHRLIVVSPSATDNVNKNLLQGKKGKLEKKIAKIGKEFGKDETFELLEKRLKLETTRLKLGRIRPRKARRTQITN